MTALLEKMRSAIVPDRQRDDPDPVAELARLHSRYVEIEGATDRLLAALKGVHEKERAAYRAFNAVCESDDPAAIDAALNAWLDLAPKSEFAQREFNAAQALKGYGAVMTKFRKEFPDAKKVLLRVCELRLTEAIKQAARILAEERQRLLPEGFSEDEVRASARAKRAAGKVSNLKVIQRRIENEPLEATWKMFTPRMLAE